jgi:acetyl-CoA acetyltransferase
MADQLIGYGEFDIVVAGGMESMANGPYLQPGARGGYRYGDAACTDYCNKARKIRHQELQMGFVSFP